MLPYMCRIAYEVQPTTIDLDNVSDQLFSDQFYKELSNVGPRAKKVVYLFDDIGLRPSSVSQPDPNCCYVYASFKRSQIRYV